MTQCASSGKILKNTDCSDNFPHSRHKVIDNSYFDMAVNKDLVQLVLTLNIIGSSPATVTLKNADVFACRISNSSRYQTRKVSTKKVIIEPNVDIKVEELISDDDSHLPPLRNAVVEPTVSYLSEIKSTDEQLFSQDLIKEDVTTVEIDERKLAYLTNPEHFLANPDTNLQSDITAGLDLSREDASAASLDCSGVAETGVCSSNGKDTKVKVPNCQLKASKKPESMRKRRSHSVQTRKSPRAKQREDVLWKDCKIWEDEDIQNMQSFHCFLCDSDLLSAVALHTHLVATHKSKKKLNVESEQNLVACLAKRREGTHEAKCILCDFTSSSFTSFQTHVRTEHFQCAKRAQKPGKDMTKVNKQLTDNITKDDTGNWMCKVCRFSRPRLLNVQTHFRRLHLRNNPADDQKLTNAKNTSRREKLVICSVCGHKTRSEYLLKFHHVTHHETNHEQLHSCAVCNKSFVTKLQLAAHGRRVHCPREQCPVAGCGALLKKRCLKYHVQSQHLERDKRHACGLCQRVFTSKSHLLTHEKNVHERRKDHRCEWPGCGRSFATSWTLKNHRFTHTGDAPFQCEQCGLRFKQKAGLNYHVRVTHLDAHAVNPHVSNMKVICVNTP